MKLILMIHHDFVSVFYCFYEWFTRPQRVALLLCTVVTLMAADATVFATIMFKVITITRTRTRLQKLCLTISKYLVFIKGERNGSKALIKKHTNVQ